MKTISQRLSYANVVATLALFIALGGVSWAAVKLPKNSVGSAQIKKNAITSAKIKKNAITGSKIKNNSLTGGDINAASLGKVPSAASADNSATTDTVQTVSKRVLASASGSSSQSAVRAQATPVPLLSHGQVSVYGKCYVYSNTLYVELFSKSTADGALANLYSYDYYYGSNGYLNANLIEDDRLIYYTSVGTNSSYHLGSPYYSQGTLFGPDGNSLTFNLSAWGKQGTIATYGNGAFGDGSVCIFAGSGTRNSAN